MLQTLEAGILRRRLIALLSESKKQGQLIHHGVQTQQLEMSFFGLVDVPCAGLTHFDVGHNISGIQIPIAFRGSRSHDILLVITLFSRYYHSNFSWVLFLISILIQHVLIESDENFHINHQFCSLELASRSPIGDTWLCQIWKITWLHMAWTQPYPRT